MTAGLRKIANQQFAEDMCFSCDCRDICCVRQLFLCWKEVKVLEIVTAEEAGFCFGVERAIDMALRAIKKNHDLPVYTLGSLIHNPQVVHRLKELGITAVDALDEIDESESIIIIRSHGIEPQILAKARQKGLYIIDATCPFVKNAQKYACKLVEEDYQTFIYGDHDHPEVRGIHGATDYKANIIKDADELQDVRLKKRVGFVAQTTKSPTSYRELICSVITDVQELKVFNTICNTTQIRQRSAIELAKDVDIMLVIGGFNSANTKRLAEICKNTGTPTFHIETASDINYQDLESKNKIGITAGASTPDWLIKEVIQAMSEEEKNEMETREFNSEQEENEEMETDEVMTNKEQENEEVELNVEDEGKEEQVEQKIEDSEEVTDVTAETEEEVSAETAEEDVEAAEGEEAEEETTAEEADTDTEPEEAAVEETAQTEDESAEEEEFKYSDNELADLKKGQTVAGTVVEINDDGVYVDVNYKTEGFIPLRELSSKSTDDPKDIVSLDDEINVVILTVEDEEGNMILSKRKADYEKAWERIMEAYENDEIIEAEVTKEVKGGLVVDVGVRGFVPASHVAIGYVEDLGQFVSETLELKVIEVERENNNVVLSAKKVMEEERKEQKEETLSSLEEGQTVTGTVTKLVNFGAFIDLGGIEGLLHISEMSWGRIGHPSDVLEERQELEVKVLGIDHEEERISLGLKQLLPDPWEEFAEKHYEGEIIEGTITKIVDFGSFMKIEEGIEGLIHISQLSQRHVKTPDEVVAVGESRKAKIINIDPEQKRVGLSLKELEDQQDKSGKEKTGGSGANKKDQDAGDEEASTSGATIGELVGDIFDNQEE